MPNGDGDVAPVLEQRVAGLEEWRSKHADAHTVLLEKLTKLDQYLSGNGTFTVAIRRDSKGKARLRFAGSLSLPAAALTGGSPALGIIYLLGRAFSWW